MTDTDPTPTMSQPTSFKVGDRVRIVTPGYRTHGHLATLVDKSGDNCFFVVCDDGVSVDYLTAAELEAHHPHDDVVALVERLGAVEFNRWVADGMLCRRYITRDGSIDLTVRVP